MNEVPDNESHDQWIVSRRGKKNNVDPQNHMPGWLKKNFCSGKVEDVAIIFLTNRECPFHCLMCDLWKNTTDQTVPAGAIPDQIEIGFRKIFLQ